MRKESSLENNLRKEENTSQKMQNPAKPEHSSATQIVLLGEDFSGRDEMNLAGNPFALLQAASKNGTSIIRYEWERRLPNGKTVNASWEVNGHSELGLPGPSDELLYLVLLQLTREATPVNGQWPQTVNFSRWEVLRRMGWPDDPKFYKALEASFKRLQSVSIYAQNSFWDARAKAPLAGIGFNLIDEFVLAVEPRGRKAQGNTSLPLSSFKWSDRLHDSFSAGNVRALALDFVLSLDSPTSRRLFRFVDMMRHSEKNSLPSFTIGVLKLRDRLGMTDYKYATKVKEKLKPAHDELISRGYLASVEYTKGKSGDALVTYHFGTAKVEFPQKSGGEQGSDSGKAVLPSSVLWEVTQGPLANEKRTVQANAEEMHALFQSFSEAEKDELRSLARVDVAPIFWDRLEEPTSPMSLKLWELVAQRYSEN